MNDTRQSALRPTTFVVVIGLSCLAIVFVSLHAAYPSTVAAAKFLGYVLIFNLLPGFVIARFILPGVKEEGVFLIFSLGVGIAANVLVVTALWSIGELYFLFVLPILAGGIAIAGFRRANLADREIGRNAFGWILGTLFVCVTALLGVGFIYSGDFVDSYSMHAAFQGVIMRGLELGWPPPNLLLPEVAWSYNYAAHLWLLGVKLTTGLPIDVLVTRYGPLFLGGASAAFMLAFGRYVVGLAWWIATLPVICVYWVIGIPPIAGELFASLMPYAANLILSPFLAILIFLLTFTFVLEEESTTSSLVIRVASLAVLTFLMTGARGVCPPILLCALSLLLVVTSWRKGRLDRKNLIDLGAALIGFAAGLRFFFTIGTGFSGAGALKFVGQPFSFLTGADQPVLTLPHTLMRWGLPWLPSGIVAFAVIVVFQAAFLTPVLPASFVKIRKRMRDVDILLIGSAIAGIAGFFLTEAPGLSHISFLYFSNISFSLLGGWGLQQIISGADQRSWWRSPFESAALAITGVLACVHLAQLPITTVAWVGGQLSASALSLAGFSSDQLPPPAKCLRDQDANLFASAGRASPAAVVIVIPENGHCGPFWWIVRFPLQTVSDYLLTFVPGSATEPGLQKTILAQKQHMDHALASAAQGVLDVSDVVAMARTVDAGRPVFVMASRGLSVQSNTGLQMVDTNDTFALWQISVSRYDQAVSQPTR
jgi:hypothetical protein